MSKRVTRFEDLEVFQQARALAKLVYELSRNGPLSRDVALRNQMTSAAVSVLSNIGEGFERGGNREFLQFLAIAKGSAGEIRAQAYLALDVGYLTRQEFQRLRLDAERTSRVLWSMIRHLKESSFKGEKYVPSMPAEDRIVKEAQPSVYGDPALDDAQFHGSVGLELGSALECESGSHSDQGQDPQRPRNPGSKQ